MNTFLFCLFFYLDLEMLFNMYLFINSYFEDENFIYMVVAFKIGCIFYKFNYPRECKVVKLALPSPTTTVNKC